MPPSAHPAKTASGPAASWWNRPFLAEAVLVAAVVLVYWNSLHAPFLFDDVGAVQTNPTIRRLWPLTPVLHPPTDGSTTTGRPVLNLTFAVNYALSGESTWGYHATNLLIHAGVALTLLGLVRRTLRLNSSGWASMSQPQRRLRERPWVRSNEQQDPSTPIAGVETGDHPKPHTAAAESNPAFAIALLWAVHPLLTESVTCIAQRTESLFGLLYLAVFYFFARGATSSQPMRWYTLSALICWLGMGAKEVMVSAPFMVLLYDRTFVAGSFAAAWRQRRGYYGTLASSWLLLAWLVLGGGGTRGVAAGLGLGVSWWSYLLTQCEALVLYLKLAFWPHPLVLDYGTAVVQSVAAVWWQGPVILALLAGTVWSLWRRPVYGFVGAWFFVILAPSSSVLPLVTQTIAEHRMYLPLAAVLCLLVTAVYRWLGAKAWFVLGSASVACGGLTIARNHDYRDTVSIWTDTVEKRPLNARARVNLGIELKKSGRPADALVQFARAIELNTESVVSGHYHAGATCLELGRVSEAIAHLQSAVQLAPEHSDAQLALGNALVQAGRPADAVAHYERALQAGPAADAHYNLGVVFAQLGREADAIAQFSAALQLQPALANAHHQLARTFSRTGRPEEAAWHFAEALRLAPELAEAHSDFGIFLARSGRLPEAVGHLQKVAQLKPAQAEAHANLGNALLLLGRVPEAIEQYETALRLRPDDPRTKENLQLAREALQPSRG